MTDIPFELPHSWLLIGYCIAIAGASWFGGWLPSVIRMSHTSIQVAMSFVAGLILGVALYHMLPHALVKISGPEAVDTVVWWMMAGVILLLLLLRFFHFHQHDFSTEGTSQRGQRETGAHSLSWLGIAAGLGLHALTEGAALGVSIRAASVDGTVIGLAGLGVFLAIFLHKPLDTFSIASMARAAGLGRRLTTMVNVAFALLCPLGALLTFWGLGLLGEAGGAVIGRAMAFAAGTFLCISLSDLLPEVHSHSHDRMKLAAAFLLGIGLAYALHFVEPAASHGMPAH